MKREPSCYLCCARHRDREPLIFIDRYLMWLCAPCAFEHLQEGTG